MYIQKYTLEKIVNVCDLPSPRIELLGGSIHTTYHYDTTKFNSTMDNYIFVTVTGKIQVKNSGGTTIKLGKILKALWPELNSTEIEKYTTKWKSLYEVDTSTVCISTDVADIYNTSACGGSCMANKGEEFFDIYKDVGTSIAYILDEYGELGARCLYWDQNIVDSDGNIVSRYDRIFFSKEIYKITLQKYFEDKGVPCLHTDGNYYRTITPIQPSYDSVPYIDSLHTVIEYQRQYYLSTDKLPADVDCCVVDFLQNTDGSSSDGTIAEPQGVYCEDDNEYHNEDDCIYVDGYGYCYNTDDWYWSEYHDHYIFYDEVVYAEDIMSYMFIGESWHCEQSTEWYYETDKKIAIHEGGYVHQDYIDDYIYCEDVASYVYIDDAYYVEDLEVYWHSKEDLHYCDDNGIYYTDIDWYNETYKVEEEMAS